MSLLLLIEQNDIPIQDKMNLSKMYGENFVIHTIEAVILFFIIGALSFAAYTLIRRTILNKRLTYIEERKVLFDNYLLSLVAPEEDEALNSTSSSSEIVDTPALDMSDIADPLGREILLKQLLSIHKQVQGEEAKKIKQAYLTLGFKKFALEKLRSRQWDVIVSGLQELMQIRIRDAYKDIFKLLSHKEEAVRTVAMKAYIQLNVDPLDFLLDVKEELSEWQKKEILYSLEQLPLENIPEFKNYLSAKNNSVIEFIIYLIGHFNQEVEENILEKYLAHTNVLIRLSAIKTIGILGYSNLKQILKDRYTNEIHGLKIEIIQTLGLLCDENDSIFFEEIALSDTPSLSIPAIVSLKKTQDKSLEYLIQSLVNEDNKENISKLVAHVNALN